MMAESGASGDHHGDERGPAEGPRAAGDVCGYIAEMCVEMIGLAAASGHEVLAYLLDMARYEADRLTREKR